MPPTSHGCPEKLRGALLPFLARAAAGVVRPLVDDGTDQCVTVVCWYSVSAGSPSTSV